MTIDERIEDRNLIDLRALVPPREIKAKLPLSERAARVVIDTRSAIRDILHGRDRHRLLVVVGPCSIHDPAAAMDYAQRLRRVAERTSNELVIVMRTYFEKPRTTVGWKGLINDPRLDGSCDVPAGLELARSLLLDINELGVACATEFLDPVVPQYKGDLISWAAIGARTAESQTHREMASGLSMPVGFKNGTDGNLATAINGMVSARHSHSFLGITSDGAAAVVRTKGNSNCHIILRGGGGRPNYDSQHVEAALEALAAETPARSVMVDCSHGNSGKDHHRQAGICRTVVEQFGRGRRELMGLMLESNLLAGKQDWKKGVALAYGVSITDACIGWDETEALLAETATAVARGVRTLRKIA